MMFVTANGERKEISRSLVAAQLRRAEQRASQIGCDREMETDQDFACRAYARAEIARLNAVLSCIDGGIEEMPRNLYPDGWC